MAIVVVTPRFHVRDLTKFPGYGQSAIAWFEYLVGIGAVYFTVGPLLGGLLPDTKWSLSVVSAAILIRGLLGIVAGPLTGFLLQRVGVRRVVLIGGISTAVFTAVTGLVTNPLEFALVFGVALAFADGFMGNIPPASVVHRWFLTRRSVMMGLVNSGAGFGGLIFAPVMALLVTQFGWRQACLILGAIILVCTIPALFLKRGAVESGFGLDGVEGRAVPKVGDEDVVGTPQATIKQIMKHPVFWMIFFMFGVEAWALGTFAADQAIYLQTQGISTIASSAALGAAAGVAAASGILLSRISDRVSPYYTLIGAVSAMFLGSIVFLFAHGIALVWVYSVLFGAGYGLFVPTLPVAISRYFGSNQVARALGVGAIVSSVMGGLGPFVTAQIVGATGNFTLAIQLITGLLAAALVVSIIARPPKFALKTVKEIDPSLAATTQPEVATASSKS
jgi:MFS family permease